MENNKRFDVYEFTIWVIEDGLKPIKEDIEDLAPYRKCVFGHKVEVGFMGDPLIQKIMYKRDFDCVECKNVINYINEKWEKWIPIECPPKITREKCYLLRDS
jgi:hypothetical protein